VAVLAAPTTGCPIGLALLAAGIQPICVGFKLHCLRRGGPHATHLPLPPEAARFFCSATTPAGPLGPTRFFLTILEEPAAPSSRATP